MMFYTLDYVIEKIKNQNAVNQKQLFFQQIGNKNLTEREAEFLWSRIEDHKWYVSEKLGRDIGFKVAAVDFLENIYETKNGGNARRHNDSVLKRRKILSLI